MKQLEQQLIDDMNLTWLESRWSKFTGSNIISLMSGVDDPELLDEIQTVIVINAIKSLAPEDFSKSTGKPLIKSVNNAMLGTTVTAKQSDYAFKQMNPYTEGLKTYAESVAIEGITEFTPDLELTKPWIVRGKELETTGIEKLSIVLDIDFENVGHEQQSISYADDFCSTPDGVIKTDGVITGGVEGKCPNSVTHWKYLNSIKDAETLKEVEPRYYWQTLSHMICTETDQWNFFSYDDRFNDPKYHLHHCMIERNDEDVAKILKRLDMAREWRDMFLLGSNNKL